jgi:hypothetical protein
MDIAGWHRTPKKALAKAHHGELMGSLFLCVSLLRYNSAVVGSISLCAIVGLEIHTATKLTL